KNEAAEVRYRQALQASADAQEVKRARAGLDAITLELRQEAMREVEAEVGPQQAAMESRLRGMGATRIGRYKGINMLTAEVPGGALASLEADPEIARVWPVEKLQSQIVNSVPAMGAPTFWTNGYTGQGESVAVLDSGVRTNHPAFAGKNIVSQVFLTYGSTDSCFADNLNSAQDQVGHGTHVAGIVASQGSREGSKDWTHYQGVAKGIDTLCNLKIAYEMTTSGECSLPGNPPSAEADMRDVATALDWLVASTPVRVLNFSYGQPASGGDDVNAQLFDYYADTYDLSVAVAGGNGGPSYLVASPAIGYNIVSVANWDTGGASDNSHEVINPTSSPGKTFDGRNKPDVAAPGTNIYSTAYDWDGNSGSNPDFVPHSGTSMAAPHIAGALALIRSTLPSSGEEGLAAKAILLNSTDTPGGLGWQNDAGWGYLNLRTAWAQRSFSDIALLGVPTDTPVSKLYKLPLAAGPMRVTASWNRHLAVPTRDSSGGFSIASWTLNDVNVALYNQDTGDQIQSTSLHWSVDNVAQFAAVLAADHPAYGILNVNWSSSPQQSGTVESVGVAFPSAFTPATGPVLSVSCSIPPVIFVGAQFPLTCTLSNTGDLPTLGGAADIVMPFGFLGSAVMEFENVPPGQSSSAVVNIQTAPATAADYIITANARAAPYGAFFYASTNLTAHVVPNPNAAPWLAGVCPSWAVAGGGALQVTLDGANFFPTAKVYWNGTAVATTSVSTTELTASVPASLIAVPTTANLTVVNPTGRPSVGRSITVEPPPLQVAGIISTIAGAGDGCNGSNNSLGDGGPATSASLTVPLGVAVDGAGNVYIADAGDNRVRKVGPNGVISTIAGNGSAGYSGDGGPASGASLNDPRGVAVDAAGNVYIADMGNFRVRKVDSHGIISTYAGNGFNGEAYGDGGPAIDASLGEIYGVALDGAGNLYIADYVGMMIRKVNPQGTISTIAGTGN
ncbi:MAG: S8 family serine peptidase, partial [Bryobacteraceae bacterium]